MKHTEKPYDFFEHTADVGVQVYGKTLRKLFAHGGQALFEFLTDCRHVGIASSRVIELECFDREELFVRWLAELLFLFEAEKFLCCSFEPHFIRGGQLRATVHGEIFDEARHQIINQVKAVTYHQVHISRTKGLWVARVILDV